MINREGARHVTTLAGGVGRDQFDKLLAGYLRALIRSGRSLDIQILQNLPLDGSGIDETRRQSPKS